jgi:hypothetical protein
MEPRPKTARGSAEASNLMGAAQPAAEIAATTQA